MPTQYLELIAGNSVIRYQKILAQCADEKSNESVEDMDRTFTGWQSMVQRFQICIVQNPTK